MTLQKLFLKKWADDFCRNSSYADFFARTFGQIISMGLEYAESSMSLSLPLLFARKITVRSCWIFLFALPSVVFSQTNYYGANGAEYPVIGQLAGDQVWPDVAIGANGGFVVWQDN